MMRYQIYEDRIEILPSPFYDKKETYPLELFFQARFEDEFNSQHDFLGIFNMDTIYLYTNHTLSSKWIHKNRLKLPVTDWKNRNEVLIDILQAFQDQGVQVYVKTKRKPVLSGLKLDNWDKS